MPRFILEQAAEHETPEAAEAHLVKVLQQCADSPRARRLGVSPLFYQYIAARAARKGNYARPSMLDALAAVFMGTDTQVDHSIGKYGFKLWERDPVEVERELEEFKHGLQALADILRPHNSKYIPHGGGCPQ